ncbi:MAG: cytochrome c [Hyphomicrobiales bacterium]|nr:cytochrome c [Hyphomicrobiales bacterium]
MARLTPRPRRRIRVSWRRILSRAFKLAAVAGVVVLAWQTYAHLFERRETTFADDAEFFKYGPIGNEAADGLPHKIWAVLPKVCPKLIDARGLPEGREYEAFGFLFEDGRDHPIGFSKTRIGFDRVAINCAVCHSQRYTLAPDAPPVTVIGGAANRLDSLAYLRFISGCVGGPDFTADTVLAAVSERFPDTTWFESLTYRLAVIPMMRDAVLKTLTERYAWTWDRPAWGPGRVDPFNPVKFDYLRQPIDKTVGNSDMMLIWNTEEKVALSRKLHGDRPVWWHYDGLSSDLWEVILNSAFGDGTRGAEFKEETFRRIEAYLRELKSPKAPLPPNEPLRAAGEAVFNRECASCHGLSGKRTLTLIPKDEIGTDPNRLAMWTAAATAAYNAYDDPTGKNRWRFDNFHNNEAYLAQPLWGVWLAAPYLHNGSVPTLYDLLRPPAERPKAFIRGLEQIDVKNGGYVAPPCDPASHVGPGFCYDTAQQGNSPQGHDYGTALSEAEKRALVWYLMSL